MGDRVMKTKMKLGESVKNMKLGEPLCNKVLDCFYEITYREVRESVKAYMTSGLMWSTLTY